MHLNIKSTCGWSRYSGKYGGLESDEVALLRACCVALGEWLGLSEPQPPRLSSGDNYPRPAALLPVSDQKQPRPCVCCQVCPCWASALSPSSPAGPFPLCHTGVLRCRVAVESTWLCEGSVCPRVCGEVLEGAGGVSW